MWCQQAGQIHPHVATCSKELQVPCTKSEKLKNGFHVENLASLVIWAAVARVVRVHVTWANLQSVEFHADREGVVQQKCYPQKDSPKGNKGCSQQHGLPAPHCLRMPSRHLEAQSRASYPREG